MPALGRSGSGDQKVEARPPGRATAANRPREPRTQAAPSSRGSRIRWSWFSVGGTHRGLRRAHGRGRRRRHAHDECRPRCLRVDRGRACPIRPTRWRRSDFEQQSSIYDRTGKVLLASLGSDRRDLVTFDEIPPELVDATTSIEDKTFWENPGFDPFGIRVRRRRQLRRPAARRLDRDDAARPHAPPARPGRRPAAPGPEGDGDRPGRAPHERVPGRRGQAADHDRLPQQQLLRESDLRGGGSGARATGTPASIELTLAQVAILAAIPQSPTRYDLMTHARDETTTDSRGREITQLVVPPTAEVVQRRNYILQLMKARSVLSAGHHTTAEYDEAMFDPVVLTPPPAVPLARAALRVAGARGARADPVRRRRAGLPGAVDGRLPRHHDPRLPDAADRREVAVRGGHRPQPEGPATRAAMRGRSRGASGGGSSRSAATTSTTPRVPCWTTAPGRSSRTAGRRPTRPIARAGSSRSSTSWRMAGASRARRSSRSGYLVGIDERRMTAATVFMDVVTNFASRGTKPWYPTQADRLERGPVRAPPGAPVLAQHPGDQGRRAERDQAPAREDEGVRPALSDGHAGRGLAEHRHARHPPDRPDQRLRDDRERRRPHAAAHGPRGPRPGRRAGVARQRTSARRASGSPRARRPTSSRTSSPGTPTVASTRSGVAGGSRTA